MKFRKIRHEDIDGLGSSLTHWDWYNYEMDYGQMVYTMENEDYCDYDVDNSKSSSESYIKYGSIYPHFPPSVSRCIPIYSVHIERNRKIESILNLG